MTMKINASQLASALKAAEKIVENRNTIPILSTVRLQAADDTLTITTTNLDIEYRQVLDAKVDAPISACVDAKRLAAMASAAKGDMSMALDKDILTIKAGRSRWGAPVINADDFPEMPVSNLCAPINASLETINRRVLWAASDKEARYYLRGAYMHDDGGTARFVSTNGHVLATMGTSLKWPKDAPSAIIPDALVKVIADAGDGSIAWDDKKLQFTSAGGSVTITGKMIDGTFPDYKRVIPEVSSVWQVDSDDMTGAIKRVRIASDAKERKLRIKPTGDALELRIEGTAGFQGGEEVEAQCDHEHETMVNADYMLAMLDAAGGVVRVSQSDSGSPMRFDPVDDTAFVGVCMPMRF